ncbi:MAG: hypothetical protein HRU23_00045 [Gammaproteobacteria bacterium]|nr:hypothetical protein [Gammaproteobacteria bacterium]
MFKIALVTLVVFGVLIVYLTNKHQKIMVKPLNKKCRYAGYLLILFSLLGWLNILTTAAGFFLWLMIIFNALMLVPLGCYLYRGYAANAS